MRHPDAIVLGSGPAGVSAAWALTDEGANILHLEAGERATVTIPSGSYADFRLLCREQWRFMLGPALEALDVAPEASPKFRVPHNARLFAAWSRENPVRTSNFTAQGMLGVGGMSNAWGGGVARFDDSELSACHLSASELIPSYERVERRIGISGDLEDDLAAYFGPMETVQPPVELVGAVARLMDGYRRRRSRVNESGLRLGRNRLALLTQDQDGRRGCGACNFCLYGCERRAIYNASDEIPALERRAGYRLETNFVAERIEPAPEGWRVLGRKGPSGERLARVGRHVVLACGTIVSTRLALDALRLHGARIRVQCHPTGALGIIVPAARPRRDGIGVAVGQVDYTLEKVVDHATVYGSLLPVDALPLSSLLARTPFGRAPARIAMRRLTPLTLAANLFLPSSFSRCHMTLGADGEMVFEGGLAPEAEPAFGRALGVLRRGLFLCGGWIVPGSLAIVEPGADLHYIGTIPHSADESPLTSTLDGEVRGLPGVYVVDGAALARAPAKPPTLTIMANADRIARKIARDQGAPSALGR